MTCVCVFNNWCGIRTTCNTQNHKNCDKILTAFRHVRHVYPLFIRHKAEEGKYYNSSKHWRTTIHSADNQGILNMYNCTEQGLANIDVQLFTAQGILIMYYCKVQIIRVF